MGHPSTGTAGKGDLHFCTEFLLVCPVVFQGILTAAVHEKETFSFCMCNPPFFQSLQEAGRNPSTAYGGATVANVMFVLSLALSCPSFLFGKSFGCHSASVLQFVSKPSRHWPQPKHSLWGCCICGSPVVGLDGKSVVALHVKACNMRAPCYLGGHEGYSVWTVCPSSPQHIFCVVFNRLATTQAQPTEVPPVLAVLGVVMPKFCPRKVVPFVMQMVQHSPKFLSCCTPNLPEGIKL